MAAAAAALAATSSAGCVSAAATCSFLHKSLPLSQRAAVARSVIGTRIGTNLASLADAFQSPLVVALHYVQMRVLICFF